MSFANTLFLTDFFCRKCRLSILYFSNNTSILCPLFRNHAIFDSANGLFLKCIELFYSISRTRFYYEIQVIKMRPYHAFIYFHGCFFRNKTPYFCHLCTCKYYCRIENLVSGDTTAFCELYLKPHLYIGQYYYIID